MERDIKSIDDKYYDLVSIEDLRTIINEGDKLLKDTYNSEKDLTSKLTFFFNILVGSELAIFAFLIKNIAGDKNVILLISSVLLLILFAIPIYNIYSILFVKIGLSGIKPFRFFNDDIIKDIPEDTTKNILYTKVTSLQNAIDNNIEEHRTRLNKYQKNIRTVILSILITFIYSVCHYFLPYLCMLCNPCLES
ncbi:hypothetical protein [Aquimarina mytili]|uniref:Uncharacterized protein n=1 Tax=Aquimarina mytili TaxID=874423 RepID=A0A937DA74_9FLAO|nr:hypothetical protein [Aquimarina mytili]MBL0685735.1 hypothetical protein [Aquimarina mytili]